MNTRIQVENGVSAAIARIKGQKGVDIIAEQIRSALGTPLGYTQADISFEGVGIEYRIIAEDPDNRFTPWVGRIDEFGWKQEDWLSMHTHVPTDKPYDIPTEFDPNLALGIVWGKDLAEVRKRGVEFLDDLVLKGHTLSGAGIKSNVEFLRKKTTQILLF